MTIDKPLARDLSHHLSNEARTRQPSRLKGEFKYFVDPNIISLGGGLPMADYFPFDNLSVDSLAPPFNKGIHVRPEEAGDKTTVELAKYRTSSKISLDIPFSESLQYGTVKGHAIVTKFLREHNERIHNVAYKDWDIVLTVGNTQAWDTTTRVFCNPGDVILAEEFTFTSAIETAKAHGLTVVPVAINGNGIDPEKFAAQLDKWAGPKPKLLYTIPTGQNPTGSTASEHVRRSVYQVCQKHDIIIVEDEPYYFLQMDPYTSNVEERERSTKTCNDFVSALAKSYLEFDTDGRVIRLDSFSKVLCPGLRLGWVVGPQRLLAEYIKIMEGLTQGNSGFSLSIVNGLLQRWGQDGYLEWLEQIRKVYTAKRDAAVTALLKHLPKEVTSFTPPVAGMFFWFQVDAAKHPRFKTLNSDPAEFEVYIQQEAIKRGAHMIPGSWFRVTGSSPNFTQERSNSAYFRGTFASVPADKLDQAIAVYGKLLHEEFNIKH